MVHIPGFNPGDETRAHHALELLKTERLISVRKWGKYKFYPVSLQVIRNQRRLYELMEVAFSSFNAPRAIRTRNVRRMVRL